MRYSSMVGVATLSPDLSSTLPELEREMEFKSLRKHGALSVQWGLMRRPGHRQKALEKLWRVAARESSVLAGSAPRAQAALQTI
jgi:hypothetical protein